MSSKEKVQFANVKLGSDTFENAYSPILYNDGNGKYEPLFILENNDLGEIMLTMELRDKDGEFLTKLWRNNFVPQTDESVDGQREFETKRIPNSFTLTRIKDGAVLFYAKAEMNSWIINGVFHFVIKERHDEEDKKKVEEEVIMKIDVDDLKTVISKCIRNKYSKQIINNIDVATFSNNKMRNSCIKISEKTISV